jgi:hypothetical protein
MVLNVAILFWKLNTSDEVVSATLMPRKNLMDTWEKALQLRATDPDGAITSARTLLESTFKHVLDEKGISYSTTEIYNRYMNWHQTLLIFIQANTHQIQDCSNF